MIRDHGQVKKYYHDQEGYNGRLDAIQAGFLNVKLAHLERWNELRRTHAARYNQLLAGVDGIVIPYEPSWSRAVYHLYVIRTEDRDGLMLHLKQKGIGTAIHYPIPLHLQKAYSELGYLPKDLPVATRVAEQIVSLPMFPQLKEEQQVLVAEEVSAFTRTSRASEENGRIASPLEVTA